MCGSHGVAAQTRGQDALHVTTAARAMVPGELIVVTISGAADASRVETTLFDKAVAAARNPGGDWQAIVGIDLDQAAGAYALTTRAFVGPTQLTDRQQLKVGRKEFATRTLRVSPDFVDPPAGVQSRIADDAAFLRAVFERVTSERFWRVPFVQPVAAAPNSRFGTRSVFNGQRRSPHNGADFPAGTGTPVKAPNAGRIVAARDLYFSGQTVIIDHGTGLFSTLAHLSRIDVREGDSVEPGDVVGLVGATGRVTGPHLHWALRVSGARVDPMSALAVLGDPRQVSHQRK
jgi:murein DD-endopeptidase MepM/ murein hydrolase activator NlpD